MTAYPTLKSLISLGVVVLGARLPSTSFAAVERVICVPWQGDPLKYHTAIDGQSVRLKGVVRTTDTSAIWYRWVFGDGTESPVATLSGARSYNLEVDHVYRGVVGTPFTARLLADSVDASMANATADPYLLKLEERGLDARVNVAIDNGLWYLHKNRYFHANLRSFNTRPIAVWRQTSYETAFASPTASAIHAFQINGHKQTGDDAEDPYVTNVRDGFNWLFNGYWQDNRYPMLRAVGVSLQSGGDPDTDHNGIGIEARDFGNRPIYQGGMVIDAIIASGTPNEDSGRDFDADGINETYREVVQDMCDLYAWGQVDSGSQYGGWRYGWNSDADNSAAQWAAIGLLPAQEPVWNCIVPAWVKSANNAWLNRSHQSLAGGLQGGFGYTGSGSGDATTPGGMVQLAFVGAGRGDIRWDRCERWFAENWKDTGRDWLDRDDIYGFYAFAKAMRVALPVPITAFAYNGFDWYRGSAQKMGLAQKVSDRLIASHAWTTGPWVNETLGTSWAVIILRPVLFQEAPIACFNAQPNPTYADTIVEFDPACSGHSDPAKSLANLVLFEWDWNNDGTFDAASPGPDVRTHAFACASIPCIYPVTLRVTDDVGNKATFRQDIRITDPPHPPVARPKGPYWISLCDLDGLRLDATDSFDPDEGNHEAGCVGCPSDTLTAWEWDLNGAPWTYPGPAGAVVDLGPDWHQYFPSFGTFDIGVRVTDNTSAAYPGSRQPNLTHEAFTKVHLFEEGPCDLTLAGGCQKATLSWEANGSPRYAVLVSGESANTGFRTIAETTSTSVELVDLPLGVERWVRIAANFDNRTTLSQAIRLLADPQACRPIADAGGPYEGCVTTPVELSAAKSTAILGSLVAWQWDLDGDGSFDDASGERVSHRWDRPGTYRIGVRVTSDGSTVLSSDAQTTVEIAICRCLPDLEARPKVDKIQLTWTHEPDADSYSVYRNLSPWFELTADRRVATGLQTTYATFLDANVPMGATYYYRVAKVVGGQEICLSDEVHGTTIPRRLNLRPLANAGPDQEVPVGRGVQLDGSRSFDPNGSAITFRWRFVSLPQGSQAALEDPSSPRPNFTPDLKGSYTAELVVNDGTYDSLPDRVVVRTQNAPPEADPGLDHFVPVGSIVELNASKSTDPDDDPLTFRWFFAAKPPKSDARILDPKAEKTSVRIDAAGTYEIALVANDGVADSEPAILTISTINSPPVAQAGADRLVAVHSKVDLDGSASSDIDGDPLSFEWSLPARPAGSSAFLGSPTSPQTSFVPDLPGTFFVQLVVSDGSALSQPDGVTVIANAAPTANAGPDRITRGGIATELDGSSSSDLENDPLTFTWSLVSKPQGSQAALGQTDVPKPSFTPDRKGEYTLELRVSDGLSVSGPDTVIVVAGNSAPTADAGPDLEVNVGQLVALSGTASTDPDSDPLAYSWSLLAKPADSGAVLADASSAAPSFHADVPGEYRLELVVTDGEAASTPDSVAVRTRNRPPTAEAGPGQARYVGDVFALDGRGSSDPDRDPLRFAWSVVSAPPNSHPVLEPVDSPTPTFTTDVEGEYLVELIVNDGTTPSLPDPLTLLAKPFRIVPNVVGLLQATATQSVSDAGLTTGTVTLRADALVPAGIVLEQMPASGTKVDPGTPVSLVVSSGADTRNPTVTLTATPTRVPVGGSVLLKIVATDDGSIADLELTVNDVPVTLDGDQAFFVCPVLGPYHAKATATDSAGNQGEARTTFYAIDPNDTTPPVAAITSPADNATVTAITDVTGSAYDPAGQFGYYTVEIAPADQVDLNTLESPAFVEIARSTTPVQDGKLATFDPTLLQNDAYVIRLTAWDQNGQGDRKAVVVNVTGELKLGNFRLEFADLTIPVAGVPIQITRIYDTLDANRTGDFGFGWRLGIRDARIFETLRPSGVGPTMYPGCRVFINTPDGRRVGFTAYTRSNGGFFFPWIVEVAFRPDPGVYERLESAGYSEGALNAIFLGGQYFDGLGDQPYDPGAYRLILEDGTAYDYSQTDGLELVTDPNRNRLDFTPAGIFHYASGSTTPDQKIDFHRDAAGRITRIVDPDGNSLVYGYDAAGDLLSFTDQEANLTRFTYHPLRAHYLQTIVDPLGRQAIRTEYDEQGRVVAIIDALGHRTEQGFDTARNSGTFTDANGNVTTQYFDARGNIVKTVDPLGAVTEFQFDANDNEISRKDPRGFVTRREYDTRGNVTKLVDALGNTTTITYDERGKRTSLLDPLGNRTNFGYDPAGNLVQVVSSAGGTASYTRDEKGRITKAIDFSGNETVLDYSNGCGCGKPSSVIYPDGSFKTYAYDNLGQVTRETDEIGNVTLYQHDRIGRLVTSTDPNGATTRFEYEGSSRTRRVDSLGRTTRYLYDSANRQIGVVDPLGSLVAFEYDRRGNQTSVTDASGNVTRFRHDAANRIVEKIDPNGRSTRHAYDLSGNRTETIDRNGRRRTFEFDGANRPVREIWWEGDKIVRTIDVVLDWKGLMLSASDSTGSTRHEYDSRYRRVRTAITGIGNLPEFSMDYTHDAMGNTVASEDSHGNAATSEFDARNRRSRTSWIVGGRAVGSVRFRYDPAGNRIGIDRHSGADPSLVTGRSRFEYNHRRAITAILHEDGRGVPIARYSYTRDSEQQTTRRVRDEQVTDFTYDAAGQLTSAVYSDLQPDEFFSYDSAGNRSGNDVRVAPGNRVIADGRFEYTYDAEGNLTERRELATGKRTEYVFDHRNQITAARAFSPDGALLGEVLFTYDALNRRISRTSAGKTTYYLHDGRNIRAEISEDGNEKVFYLTEERMDSLLARHTASRGVDWYLTDDLGSVRNLAGRDGTGDASAGYSAFGSPTTGQEGGLFDRFRFGGREYDQELGLYFHRARYMDPNLGRFVSEDPLGLCSGDPNPYRYGFNSPTTYVDPDGRISILGYAFLLGFTSGFVAATTYCRDMALEVADHYPDSGNYRGEKDFMRHCTWLCCSNRFGLIVSAPAIWLALGPAFEIAMETDENFGNGAEGWRRLFFDIFGSDIMGLFASIAPTGCESACQGLWSAAGP